MREPRVFRVVSCFDCGYVGNRPDEQPGDTGWSIPPVPWIENVCPECGESAGPWIEVREVVE